MQRIMTIIFCWLTTLACQTQNETTLNEDQFDQLDNRTAIDPNRLPPSMWSQAQRQASAGYYYLVGEYTAMKGDLKVALDLYKAAYQLDPVEFLAEKYLGTETRISEGQETLLHAKKMTLLYPKSAYLHLLLGELLIKYKEYDDALAETRLALKLNPRYEKAFIQLVSIYQKKGQLEKSLQAAKSLVEKIPGSVFGWSLLSRIYLHKKNYKKALRAVDKAHSLQNNNPELVILYAYLAEKNNRPKKALNLYIQFFRRNVKHEEIVSRTILLLKTFGSLDNALNKVEQLVKKPRLSGLTSLQVQRVFLLWELKRVAEGSKLLKELVNRNPHSAQLVFFSGMSYERLGNKNQAIEQYKIVPEESDYYIPAQYKICQILREQKQYKKAIEVINEILDHKYASWELYILAANIFGDLDEFEQAIQVLQKGYKRYQLKTRLLFMRGVYEEKSKDYEACIETMKEVIAKDPQFSSAYNYLGYLYAERGENLEEAEKLILQALILKPNDGYYFDSLGWVYYMQGKYKQAIKYLQKSVSLLPNEGVILEHLADAYLAIEQKDKALELYQKALKGNLDEADSKRVKDKINDLN
ncbi:MAG: tetratricopeptide repeat protein [Oligoflexales bacterium]